MDLLPAAFVVDLLRTSRATPFLTSLAFALPGHSQISRWCQQIYFPSESISLGLLSLVHGLLFFLILEKQHEPSFPIADKSTIDSYVALCEHNFHHGVETYEVTASATLDNAKALLLAALKAQEDSKPVYGWNMVSCAARHALSLGLHRKASLRNDTYEEAEDKKRLFWMIYCFDKNLALNLGRTPNIQDYDMDIDFFAPSPDPGIQPWDQANLMFIELSRTQGLLYEKLYSLTACQNASERDHSILGLTRDFESWHAKWKSVRPSSPPSCTSADITD